MNRALLAKAAWRLHSEGSGLWANIFDDKYLKGKPILEYKKGFSLSPSWRGICDGMALLEKGYCGGLVMDLQSDFGWMIGLEWVLYLPLQ